MVHRKNRKEIENLANQKKRESILINEWFHKPIPIKFGKIKFDYKLFIKLYEDPLKNESAPTFFLPKSSFSWLFPVPSDHLSLSHAITIKEVSYPTAIPSYISFRNENEHQYVTTMMMTLKIYHVMRKF